MARIRSLKPGFFTNEHLAELPFEHRLCFAGLWTLADREGRLEDRPRRIKGMLFPYDTVDVDAMLTALAERDFVIRYEADGFRYLAIPTFLQHQRPKTDEAASVIPAPLLENPRGKVTPPRSYKGQGTEDRGQGTEGEGADAPDASALQMLWNERTTPPIARCRELSTKRRRQIRSRLTERPLTEWAEVIERIERSTFCRGQNDRGWIASFDWLIGAPDVAVKVLEGKYDDRLKTERPYTAAEMVVAKRMRETWGGCRHEPRCQDYGECVTVIARMLREREGAA